MPDPTRDAVAMNPEDRDLEKARLLVIDVCEDEAIYDGRATKFTLALITAAETRGREQERARLAALATEHEWDLVIELADATRDCMAEWAGVEDAKRLGAAKESLFAAFAAQRERVVEEWIDGLTDEQLWELGSEEWYPYDRKPNGGGMRAGVATPEVMRRRIRALLAAPTKGEGA